MWNLIFSCSDGRRRYGLSARPPSHPFADGLVHGRCTGLAWLLHAACKASARVVQTSRTKPHTARRPTIGPTPRSETPPSGGCGKDSHTEKFPRRRLRFRRNHPHILPFHLHFSAKTLAFSSPFHYLCRHLTPFTSLYIYLI